MFFFGFTSFDIIQFLKFKTEPEEINIFIVANFLQKFAKQFTKLILLLKIKKITTIFKNNNE